MRVLVACEFSGIVRDAFIERGHDAMSCDLLPTERPGPHYRGDVTKILDQGWDLMIAHPPCTYLCRGGLTWLNRRPEWRGEQEKAIRFVRLLMEAPIDRIAIENPIGKINTLIRKPDQIIYPHQFGHIFRKDVCLWLKGLPLLIPTYNVPGPHRTFDPGNGKMPSIQRRKVKSRFFKGIARAMAEQWGGNILKQKVA